MEERREYTCKDDLRRKLKNVRAAIADKHGCALRATERILTVLDGDAMVYVSIGSELDTSPLIRALTKLGKTVFVPYTYGDDITPRVLAELGGADKRGNLDERCYAHTTEIQSPSVCVVPLLGVNSNGFRIGYGKGCYDRFFAKNSVKKIGFAYDEQFVEFLPEPHDIALDCCVTPSKVIYF